MPIKRWHGWGAWCSNCKEWVDLGDGITAWETRDQVEESLDIRPCDSIEQAIRDACSCSRKPKVKVPDA